MRTRRNGKTDNGSSMTQTVHLKRICKQDKCTSSKPVSRSGAESYIDRVIRRTELSAVTQCVGVLRRRRFRHKLTAKDNLVLRKAFINASKLQPLNSKKKRLLSRDISMGLEHEPIPAVCYTGNSNNFAKFTYLPQNDHRLFKGRQSSADFTLCCDCVGECGVQCKCVASSINFGSTFINGESIFTDKDVDFYNATIFSCGPKCACQGSCANSSNKLFKSIRTEVFRRDDALGFGVRSLKPIETGTAVIEFVGEIIDHKEQAKRTKKSGEKTSSYCWRLYCREADEKLRMIWKSLKVNNPPVTLDYDVYIDPAYKGNSARFVSHGDFPNLMALRLFQNDLHPQSARLIFVAVQPIRAGEELFYDYGNYFMAVDRNNCLCSTIGCGQSGRYLRSPLLTQKDAVSEVMRLIDHNREENKKCRASKTPDDKTSPMLEQKCHMLLCRKKALPKATSRRAKKEKSSSISTASSSRNSPGEGEKVTSTRINGL